MQITTYQHRPAAGVAARVKNAVIESADVVAGHLNAATMRTTGVSTRCNGSGIDDGARVFGIVAAVDDDLAAITICFIGDERAGILDIAAIGAQNDFAAFVD